jgi:YHS domain-containing protein
MDMNITLAIAVGLLACQKEPANTRDAMKPVQLLVGEWRIEVSCDDAKEEAWSETQSWEFKIDKEEYALQFESKGGKKLKSGVLSYDLKKKVYHLDVVRPDDKKVAFEGKLSGRELVLEEVVEGKGAAEKMSFNLLRDNRVLINIEHKDAGKNNWTQTHSYSSTKNGVPFVRVEAGKCVVTGGTPATTIDYKGVTYNLCCNSCKKEFLAHPDETIARAKKEGYVK